VADYICSAYGFSNSTTYQLTPRGGTALHLEIMKDAQGKTYSKHLGSTTHRSYIFICDVPMNLMVRVM
jgi:hypothetical protein